MNMVLKKVVALALGSTAAGGILAGFAWWRGVDVKQADPVALLKQQVVQDELTAAREFRETILEGLAMEGAPDWTGDYIHSNGFETRRLSIGPREFCYVYSHCTGTGELAYGEVEAVEGAVVRLKPTFHERLGKPREHEPGRRSAFWFEPEIYVVNWNEEQFLVGASQMPEFCRLAKAVKWESMRYAAYPRLSLEQGMATFWDSNLEGLPAVPEELRQFLPRE